MKTGEGYVGTKFRTVFVAQTPPSDARAAELLVWCRRFALLGLAGPAMGNLSFRSAGGFVITPTGTDPATLTTSDLVEVYAVDSTRSEVRAAGTREPSSETQLHAAIYLARPAVGAIFHGHSPALLAAAERLALPVTAREQPYGTSALVEETLLLARCEDFLIMRHHGFVAVGATMAEAGARVEEMMKRL